MIHYNVNGMRWCWRVWWMRGWRKRLDHYSKRSWAKQIRKQVFPEGETQGYGEYWKPYESWSSLCRKVWKSKERMVLCLITQMKRSASSLVDSKTKKNPQPVQRWVFSQKVLFLCLHVSPQLRGRGHHTGKVSPFQWYWLASTSSCGGSKVFFGCSTLCTKEHETEPQTWGGIFALGYILARSKFSKTIVA